MAYLRIKVRCFRCGKEVEKTNVRKVETITTEPRYECFTCFRKVQTSFRGGKSRIESNYLCLRCNYRYNSKNGVCPYCSKSDQVIKGKITAHDLL